MTSKLELLATKLSIGQKAASRLTRVINEKTGSFWSHESLYALLLPYSSPFTVERIVELITDHGLYTTIASTLSLSPDAIPAFIDHIRAESGVSVSLSHLAEACTILGEMALEQSELIAYLALMLRGYDDSIQQTIFQEKISSLKKTNTSVSYHTMWDMWRILPYSNSLSRLELLKDYLIVGDLLQLRGIPGGELRYIEQIQATYKDISVQEIIYILSHCKTNNQRKINNYTEVYLFSKKNKSTPEEFIYFIRAKSTIHNITVDEIAEIIKIIKGFWDKTSDIIDYINVVKYITAYKIDKNSISTLFINIKVNIDFYIPINKIYAIISPHLKISNKTQYLNTDNIIKHIKNIISDIYYSEQIKELLNNHNIDIDKFVQTVRHSIQPPLEIKQIKYFLEELPQHKRTVEQIIIYFNELKLESKLYTLISINDSQKIIQSVKESANYTISHEDILNALQCVSSKKTKNRIDQVISYLSLRYGIHKVNKPENFLKILQPHVSTSTYLDVYHHLTIIQPTDYTGSTIEQFYARNMIALGLAQTLGIPLAASRALTGDIHRIYKHTVSLRDILRVLDQLPSHDRDRDSLLGYLAIQYFITTRQITRYTPHTLLEYVNTRSDRSLRYADLWSVIQDIPVHSSALSEISTYAKLCQWIDDPAATRTQINLNLSKPILYTDLYTFWQRSASPAHVTIHDVRSFFKHVPSALLALPYAQLTEDEVWVCGSSVSALLLSRWRPLSPQSGINSAEQSRKNWEAITSDQRCYAIPSRGHAEIRVQQSITQRTGVVSLRFIQEESQAPAVLIRVTLLGNQRPAGTMVGWIRVNARGDTAGFHREIGDPSYGTFIHALAIAYYRDLVVPASHFHVPSSHTTPTRASVPTYQSFNGSHGGKPQPRPLPRQQIHRHTAPLEDWYHAQEHARHDVVGHARWISADFRADPVKYREAAVSGVTLSAGYTWVRDHDRGTFQYGTIILDGFELMYPMVFTPSARTTDILQQLLV